MLAQLFLRYRECMFQVAWSVFAKCTFLSLFSNANYIILTFLYTSFYIFISVFYILSMFKTLICYFLCIDPLLT